MTTERQLMEGCWAEPLANAPRLILADYYEEYGDQQRAEFVRNQLALAELYDIDHTCVGPVGKGRKRRLRGRWDVISRETECPACGAAQEIKRLSAAIMQTATTLPTWLFGSKTIAVTRGWNSCQISYFGSLELVVPVEYMIRAQYQGKTYTVIINWCRGLLTLLEAKAQALMIYGPGIFKDHWPQVDAIDYRVTNSPYHSKSTPRVWVNNLDLCESQDGNHYWPAGMGHLFEKGKPYGAYQDRIYDDADEARADAMNALRKYLTAQSKSNVGLSGGKV